MPRRGPTHRSAGDIPRPDRICSSRKGRAQLTKLEVRLDPPYSIAIGRGLVGRLPEFLRLEGRRVLVVTDRNVARFHLGAVESALAASGAAASLGRLVLPGGETRKNLDAVRAVYRALDGIDAGRSDLLVALGGGVVGDIAGFAAASWNRGIGFVQLPSTVLAMSDSSVGGKTGVDFMQRKNGVGAFYQPEAVVADLDFLDTLPARQVSNGMAEVIKYAYTADPALLEILAGPEPDMEEAIARSLRVKIDIVQRDPTEKGDRALCNFGHTYGHALEARYHYRHWLHGEAVSIGMMFACPSDALARVLTRWKLPLSDPRVDPRDLVDLMFRDKKRMGKKLRFVWVPEPGKAGIREMEKEELAAMAEAAAKRAGKGYRP
jgi:3-dehydroquinate synthase